MVNLNFKKFLVVLLAFIYGFNSFVSSRNFNNTTASRQNKIVPKKSKKNKIAKKVFQAIFRGYSISYLVLRILGKIKEIPFAGNFLSGKLNLEEGIKLKPSEFARGNELMVGDLFLIFAIFLV
ncbi:MAG: hypothetical protein LBJ32_01920 [Oscillospiraceae bacterium]|jgi:hypothetical protein|nr:hypothetical protein [Oscillospiraceae bacterium]